MPLNYDRIVLQTLISKIEQIFESLEQCEDPEFDSDCEQSKFVNMLEHMVEDLESVYGNVER